MQKLIREHMQKLQLKLKNVPGDASQVPCSISSVLNRDESLSIQDVILDCNNPDVNQSQHTERSLKPLVYVISKAGNPLMPCFAAKANRMIKKGAGNVYSVKGAQCKGKNLVLNSSTVKTISIRKIDNWIYQQSSLKFTHERD